MKQLSSDIRDRLARRSTVQNTISRVDVGEAVEAQESDEDGRPGSPDYFASFLKENTGEEDTETDSGREDGKGVQIDFEV